MFKLWLYFWRFCKTIATCDFVLEWFGYAKSVYGLFAFMGAAIMSWWAAIAGYDTIHIVLIAGASLVVLLFIIFLLQLIGLIKKPEHKETVGASHEIVRNQDSKDIVEISKQKTEPTIKPEKSKRPSSTEEQDFNHYAGIKDAGLDSTYTKLRELYKQGLEIQEEYSGTIEYLFPEEDNYASDDQGQKWANEVYYLLSAKLPTEAFKFSHKGQPPIELFSEFDKAISDLRAIIERYGEAVKISKQTNNSEGHTR